MRLESKLPDRAWSLWESTSVALIVYLLETYGELPGSNELPVDPAAL